jgi:hypothetical protein
MVKTEPLGLMPGGFNCCASNANGIIMEMDYTMTISFFMVVYIMFLFVQVFSAS